MGYACFTDDNIQAIVLATNLETGDVIGICGDHLTDYALGLLESVTGRKWAPVEDAATDPETGDATDDDETAHGPTTPDAPAPASAPSPEGQPGPEPDQDDGHDQVEEDGDVYNGDRRHEIDVLSRGF